ncbi:MAG: PhoPQ-activated pathogenicity [Candidatus Hydrogenedentes bacterium]|nr:PhoPQ-activated pathogenicity [Candidatus Hydrogenedentota bacterium]
MAGRGGTAYTRRAWMLALVIAAATALGVSGCFDRIAPEIGAIASPAHRSTVTGVVTVSAEVTDDQEVAAVTYRIDGGAGVSMAYVGNDTWQAPFATTAAADGRHTLQVTARDAAGNRAAETVTVAINNGGGWTETALDRYVAKPDSVFSWEHYYTKYDLGYTTYFIDMTSQEWRAANEVNRTAWQHDVRVIVPWDCGSNRTAVLLVDGGSNAAERPTDVDSEYGLLALLAKSVFIQLCQVPNQPLYFADEHSQARREDALLAYSLDKCLVTGDEEWPAHLPMAKAVLRAMDTVQAFLPTQGKQVDDFILVGFSKRAWTIWLTAAVDWEGRVKAILPGSFDVLNIEPQMDHHWEAYGFYAPAIDDYAGYDLFCRMASPGGYELLDTVDPYAYRARYTMPKFIVNSTGDQFFLPDSSPFYYHDLPGRKILRYTINTDHGQSTEIPDLRALIAWAKDIMNGTDDPEFDWHFEADGSIRVVCADRPAAVKLWQATNPAARDFRKEIIGGVFTSTALEDTGGGVYVGYVAPPAQGWSAFLVEVTYERGGPLAADRVYTTDVRVTPDVLPFEGTHCTD